MTGPSARRPRAAVSPAPRPVACAALALLLAACAGGTTTASPDGSPSATASPGTSAAAVAAERLDDPADASEPSPDGSGEPEPATPSPSPSPSPSPTPSPTPRQATSADAAGYLRDASPDGVHDVDGVALDVDDDGTLEVVLHGVRDDRGWVGVAAWDGVRYGLVARGRGGPATRVVDLRVADVTADEVLEVVLEVAGEGTASLALWSLPSADRLRPLRARGGCHDGSHVYGVVGASLVVGRDEDGPLDVMASCDDSPLPVADWSTQRWRWDGGAFVADPAPDPEPSPTPSPDGPGNGNANGNGGQGGPPGRR